MEGNNSAVSTYTIRFNFQNLCIPLAKYRIIYSLYFSCYKYRTIIIDKWLVVLMEAECVYFAVGAEYLRKLRLF